jgi:hypothetical protein
MNSNELICNLHQFCVFFSGGNGGGAWPILQNAASCFRRFVEDCRTQVVNKRR